MCHARERARARALPPPPLLLRNKTLECRKIIDQHGGGHDAKITPRPLDGLCCANPRTRTCAVRLACAGAPYVHDSAIIGRLHIVPPSPGDSGDDERAARVASVASHSCDHAEHCLGVHLRTPAPKGTVECEGATSYMNARVCGASVGKNHTRARA